MGKAARKINREAKRRAAAEPPAGREGRAQRPRTPSDAPEVVGPSIARGRTGSSALNPARRPLVAPPGPRAPLVAPPAPTKGQQVSAARTALRRAAIRRSIVEEVVAQRVRDARALGMTWADIGDCLGVTGQAVGKRYGGASGAAQKSKGSGARPSAE